MATIVNLFRDSHRNTQELLPWYSTDRLDPDERAAVEAHLADCASCRRELQSERELAAAVARLPLAADVSWTGLRQRLADTEAAPRQSGPVGSPVCKLFAWPGSFGWLLAGQAAIAMLVVVALLPHGDPSPDRSAPYRTLGSAPVQPDGNVIVIFRPDTSEAELRQTLVSAHARLVDGPTESGAYVLWIAPADRAASVAALRRQSGVVLAQPLDPPEVRR